MRGLAALMTVTALTLGKGSAAIAETASPADMVLVDGKLVNLHGRMLMPGIVDGHYHGQGVVQTVAAPAGVADSGRRCASLAARSVATEPRRT